MESVTCEETGWTVSIGDIIVLENWACREAEIVSINPRDGVGDIDTSDYPLMWAECYDGELWPCTIETIALPDK